MPVNLRRRLAAEALGSALLLAAVVGSGIMGERLAGGNVGIALLTNSIATGAALVALILTFGPISGAQLNPAVTLMAAVHGALRWREVPAHLGAQLFGALAGVGVADAMFGEPTFSPSRHARSGGALWLSESVATFGLLVVIDRVARTRASAVLFAVGGYITAAYWFTASTSFANPAVTLARAWTDTFAGIRPADAPAFLLAQFAGAAAALLILSWFASGEPRAEARTRTAVAPCAETASAPD